MHRWGAWLTAGGLHALAFAFGSAGCGGGAAADVTVTETAVEIDEYDTVAGATAFDDGYLAVTDDGVLFRSSDGTRWAQVDTTGLTGRDRGVSTSFSGIAAGDGFVLIAGMREGGTGRAEGEGQSGEVLRTPVIWRSENGERWEQRDTSGLTSTSLDTLVAGRQDRVTDGAGFVIFGSDEAPTPPDYEPTDEEAEDGTLPATVTVTSTWRSDDGETWEKFGGFVIPPGENSLEAVRSAALGGDTWLAALGVECNGCYDDFAFVLGASDDRGDTWAELDPEGLDDIELANTDVIPRIVSTGSGFVAVGTSGEGDTQATVWQSDDGRTWTGRKRLGGPRIKEYAESIDAAVATETGVIALEIAGDELVAWKVDLS